MFDLFKNTLLSFKLKKSLKTLQNQKKKKITSFKSLLIIVYENDLDAVSYTHLRAHET